MESVLRTWKPDRQCFAPISSNVEILSSRWNSGNWSGSTFLILGGFLHDSIFDSVRSRFLEEGPYIVGIGFHFQFRFTLCFPLFRASSWKCFSHITLDAVGVQSLRFVNLIHFQVIPVSKMDNGRMLRLLSKVDLVLVYILFCIQLCFSD